MSVRRFLLLAPAVVLFVLLQSYFWVPSYEDQTRGNPERREQYVAASTGDASLLNPILAADTTSGDVVDLVFEGLLDRDRDLSLRGRVAASWEISEEVSVPLYRPIAADGEALDPAAAVRRLRDRLGAEGAVTAVELVPGRRDEVEVPGKEGAPPLRVALDAPPRARVHLNRVDPHFPERLAPLLGDGYLDAFRPENYCRFPPGVDEAERQRVSRELVPSVTERPILLFHLRDGVRFQDGRPVTAADVRFTYRAIMDPRNLSPRAPDFEPVLQVDVVDPRTVRVVYKYLYSPAVGTWQMGILPKHLLDREALTREARAKGVDPESFTLRQSDFNRHPVGCGPYRFDRWRSDRYISLRRFEDYWEGAPNFRRYDLRILPDVLMQQMEFYAGTLDAYQVQPYQVERFRQDPEYQVFSGLSFGYTYIGYNLRREPFGDVRVRTALGMAIDTETIIRYLLYGEGERISGPFPKQTDYYDPDVAPLPYDPAGALRLLAEAGWRRDAGGRLMKDGRQMRFTLITNSGNDLRKGVLAIAQDSWRRLGIDVGTDLLEWSVFINERVDKDDFDALVLGWSMGVDPDLYQIWHSSQTDPYELNFVGFRDPEADRLILAIRQEYDHERLVALCHRLHALIAREQPYTFLYVPKWTAALDRRIVVRAVDREGHATYRPIRPTQTGSYRFDFNRWVKLPHAPHFSAQE